MQTHNNYQMLVCWALYQYGMKNCGEGCLFDIETAKIRYLDWDTYLSDKPFLDTSIIQPYSIRVFYIGELLGITRYTVPASGMFICTYIGLGNFISQFFGSHTPTS